MHPFAVLFASVALATAQLQLQWSQRTPQHVRHGTSQDIHKQILIEGKHNTERGKRNHETIDPSSSITFKPENLLMADFQAPSSKKAQSMSEKTLNNSKSTFYKSLFHSATDSVTSELYMFPPPSRPTLPTLRPQKSLESTLTVVPVALTVPGTGGKVNANGIGEVEKQRNNMTLQSYGGKRIGAEVSDAKEKGVVINSSPVRGSFAKTRETYVANQVKDDDGIRFSNDGGDLGMKYRINSKVKKENVIKNEFLSSKAEEGGKVVKTPIRLENSALTKDPNYGSFPGFPRSSSTPNPRNYWNDENNHNEAQIRVNSYDRMPRHKVEDWRPSLKSLRGVHTPGPVNKKHESLKTLKTEAFVHQTVSLGRAHSRHARQAPSVPFIPGRTRPTPTSIQTSFFREQVQKLPVSSRNRLESIYNRIGFTQGFQNLLMKEVIAAGNNTGKVSSGMEPSDQTRRSSSGNLGLEQLSSVAGGKTNGFVGHLRQGSSVNSEHGRQGLHTNIRGSSQSFLTRANERNSYPISFDRAPVRIDGLARGAASPASQFGQTSVAGAAASHVPYQNPYNQINIATQQQAPRLSPRNAAPALTYRQTQMISSLDKVTQTRVLNLHKSTGNSERFRAMVDRLYRNQVNAARGNTAQSYSLSTIGEQNGSASASSGSAGDGEVGDPALLKVRLMQQELEIIDQQKRLLERQQENPIMRQAFIDVIVKAKIEAEVRNKFQNMIKVNPYEGFKTQPQTTLEAQPIFLSKAAPEPQRLYIPSNITMPEVSTPPDPTVPSAVFTQLQPEHAQELHTYQEGQWGQHQSYQQQENQGLTPMHVQVTPLPKQSQTRALDLSVELVPALFLTWALEEAQISAMEGSNVEDILRTIGTTIDRSMLNETVISPIVRAEQFRAFLIDTLLRDPNSYTINTGDVYLQKFYERLDRGPSVLIKELREGFIHSNTLHLKERRRKRDATISLENVNIESTNYLGLANGNLPQEKVSQRPSLKFKNGFARKCTECDLFLSQRKTRARLHRTRRNLGQIGAIPRFPILRFIWLLPKGTFPKAPGETIQYIMEKFGPKETLLKPVKTFTTASPTSPGYEHTTKSLGTPQPDSTHHVLTRMGPGEQFAFSNPRVSTF
ncbi:hypothetical protein EGW08_014951 [Elysia chlorotica]|uniref:Uncharacterized protein n=1 Tax=Elysia chlorotica TaxID=188477 RepID=A0A3S0ZWX6_ELYCH|nr:hypothetical protein EGW08_014951 [Elysia chlorotica]